ncbi:MAG: urea ABC transporter permease subunit UrtB [Treponema sp.]|nr:urea ABC transporter permease subunit UrtB [Spirochaetia bacterium]MDD7458632.1 urea ABC transporter permease subunit UrtB [Spirochaetales bacterium]MDY5812820.1 urea ABC transporter permease subunit UrtB [Treponema sp.]
MSLFIQQLLNGISNSSVLFLTTIGLVIIFGMMDVVNNAHGEFIMIGAYTACVTVNVLHVPFAVAAILAALITGLIGIVIERLLIKKLYGKVAESLLVTFALEYIIQQIVRMVFGPENQTIDIPVKGRLLMGSISIPYYNLVLIGAALFVLALTLVLFYKTSFGMQLRAINQNRDMTQCLGINVTKINMFTFGYGAALAGFSGALIAPIKSVFPGMGPAFNVDGFLVVILGGLNSIIGSFASSFVINESITLMSGYMSQIVSKLLIFVVIIVIVRFRPNGLFSSKEKR